jgi:hypothetical protein
MPFFLVFIFMIGAFAVKKRRRIFGKHYQPTHKFGCWTGVFTIIWNGAKKPRSSPFGKGKTMFLMQDNQREIKVLFQIVRFVSGLALVTSNAAGNVIS